jgi:hypothetical protein
MVDGGILPLDLGNGVKPATVVQIPFSSDGAAILNYRAELFSTFSNFIDQGMRLIENKGYGKKCNVNYYDETNTEYIINPSNADGSLFYTKVMELEATYQEFYKREFEKNYKGDLTEEQLSELSEEDKSQRFQDASCQTMNTVGWSSPLQIYRRIAQTLIAGGHVDVETRETIKNETLNPR